jgi:hypothetical protein
LMQVKQEVFMPLIHRPGEAQVDFGYALAKVAGDQLLNPIKCSPS